MKNRIGSNGIPIPQTILRPVFATATHSTTTTSVATTPVARTTHHARIDSNDGICV